MCVCVFVCVCSHSVVSYSETPWTAAHQAPLSMGILQARILEWVAMIVNWNIFKTSNLLKKPSTFAFNQIILVLEIYAEVMATVAKTRFMC